MNNDTILKDGEPWLFTSRYAEPAVVAFDGLKVRTTVGYPRFLKLKSTLDGFVRELAPFGIFGKDLSPGEFRRAYFKRLDEIGADTIRTRLDELHTASPSGRAAALCFERIGEPCHRRWAAEWIKRKLGLVVPELEPQQGGLLP
jgi:hypothetical protein